VGIEYHKFQKAGRAGEIVLDCYILVSELLNLMGQNKFGGGWTEIQIAILGTYAKQFLTVFKNQPNQKLLYFSLSNGVELIKRKAVVNSEE
jgi:hypothetical protein